MRMRVFVHIRLLLLLLLHSTYINSFLNKYIATNSIKLIHNHDTNNLFFSSPSLSNTQLNLYDLKNCLEDSDLIKLYSKEWNFHLLETKDLDDVSDLSLECFYEPKVILDTSGMVAMEKQIWNFFIDLNKRIDILETRFGNYYGFKSRLGNRLEQPTLNMEPNFNSIVIVATPTSYKKTTIANNNQNSNNNSKSDNKNDKLGKHNINSNSNYNDRIAGMVEICLEKSDQTLTAPFRFPWSQKSADLDPYLCNLSVSNPYRRQGLSTILCQICEEIVLKKWNKDVMYLHVETRNIPAQKLYVRLGYQICNKLPLWQIKIAGLENVLYYAKNLIKK